VATRKRTTAGKSKKKPARTRTRKKKAPRAAEGPRQEGRPTLEEVISALAKAALIREEEVTVAPEVAGEEPTALATGLWDRLRQALFTRVRLGRREKSLVEILRAVNWVDRGELDRAEQEGEETGLPLGKLLLDRGLVSPETLQTARKIQERTGQPLWRALLRQREILPEQLADLLRRERYVPFLDSKDIRLGEALMELKLLSQEQLHEALRLRRKTTRPFGQLLVESGLISERELALGLARQYRVPMVDLSLNPPESEAFDQLPTELVVEHQALPISYEEGKLTVACADPHYIRFIRNLGAMLGLTAVPVIAPESQVKEAIEMALRNRGRKAETPPEPPTPSAAEREMPAAAYLRMEDHPNTRELVDSIIANAVRVRATDVHFDPQEDSLRVRYRVDGTLHDVLQIPAAAASGVVSRLKVMASLDIVERRLPQDAHLTTEVEGRPINMRVATTPTELGEKVVLRVLDEARIITALEELGLEPHQREHVEKFLKRPYGMLLVSGPVGAGKTTTLYSCMTQVNSPGRNLMTIEDPVEYRFPGANQLEVFRRIGFDFAAGLRAILRLDPDVIMVGEIRDDETAKTAMRAALTGVFVMSSVHAHDAPATVSSLFNFGIPGFLASTALVGVIAQRLVRKLCPDCRTAYKPDTALLKQLGLPIKGAKRPKAFYRGAGCDKCFHTGYYGRTGVFEVMPMPEEITDLVFRETTREVLAQVAVDVGMQPLRQSGLNRLVDGTTTVEEYFRVVWT